MKKLTVTGQIKLGELQVTSNDFKKNISKFFEGTKGKTFTITYELMDTPEHWQHKYFHGILLPDMAKAMGETDLYYLKELILKKQFLLTPASNIKDIPSRYRSRCRIVTDIVPDENGNPKEIIVGFIPSLGDLTYDNMGSFITKSELVFFEDLQGRYSNEKLAMEYKKNMKK